MKAVPGYDMDVILENLTCFCIFNDPKYFRDKVDSEGDAVFILTNKYVRSKNEKKLDIYIDRLYTLDI